MMDNANRILSDITVHMKYACFIPEINRRETWEEICDRNVAMHIARYPHLRDEIKAVYKQFVYTKKVLPSMRSMQFGGRPIELAPNRIFNCAYAPIDASEVFSEAMFMLLGGTGLGFSVQHHFLNCLPNVEGPNRNLSSRRFMIGDSIEGWADAIKVLVESYFYNKRPVRFDFRDIRPKGALLKTSGGRAPGHVPLENCIREVTGVFERAIEKRGRGTRLTSIEAHDIMCYIADAVRAGGIRRAALISLFDMDDELMLQAKGNFDCKILSAKVADPKVHGEDKFVLTLYVEKEDRIYERVVDRFTFDQIENDGCMPWWFFEPQRGRANNSAVLDRATITQQQFFKLWETIVDSKAGEPGVYFTNDPFLGTNPCCEISLRPFQFCNLTETNTADVHSQEEMNARVRAAAFIGTLQAGYTDFHYLRDIWRKTTEEEALIGVGLTGVASGSVMGLNLNEAAEVVKVENERVAQLIGINSAARTTTIKPAGTSSLTLGCSSGCHAYHNDYYIRRIRVGKNEAIYRYLVANHPELVADDVFNPENEAVIEVPQKAPEGAVLRHESALELLERVRRLNTEWVHPGHRTGANTHNVSCTINVKEHEWDAVGEWMWENRNAFNGIAVLPHDGGTYLQTPFEDCTAEEYERRYKFLRELDLTRVIETEDNTDLSGEVACGGGGCEVR